MSFLSLQDQTGRTLNISRLPERIVSLVPSQTELLFDLGLENQVVGITKFCIHPPHWFKTKTRVGGTKNVSIKRVSALNPDLVIANKEENTQKDILAISEFVPVYVSDIKDLQGAMTMIKDIGELCGKSVRAAKLIDEIKAGIQQLKNNMKNLNLGSTPRVLYLIWKDPFMAAGTDTFINAMLEETGFKNALSEEVHRYPIITPQEITNLAPDYVFLSSEPFPFKGKHTSELKAQFPDLCFIEVDGEAFSWYGSRLVKRLNYFESLHTKIKQIKDT